MDKVYDQYFYICTANSVVFIIEMDPTKFKIVQSTPSLNWLEPLYRLKIIGIFHWSCHAGDWTDLYY